MPSGRHTEDNLHPTKKPHTGVELTSLSGQKRGSSAVRAMGVVHEGTDLERESTGALGASGCLRRNPLTGCTFLW